VKKVLILHSYYSPTNQIVNVELIKYGVEVHVVRWDKSENYSIYTPSPTDRLSLYPRSDFKNVNQMYDFILKLAPRVILVSGTMDSLYNRTCSKIRRNTKIPVVGKSDAQFKGGKDWIKVFLSPIRHKRWFDYMFVPGIWQYEFARLLGYSRDKILLHNLSANVELFTQVDIDIKIKEYPKNFLYIGRYSPEKGIIELVKAWKQIRDKKGWTLTLVGEGPLKNKVEEYPDITCFDHMSQESLIELIQNSGCFVLPSLSDANPLVLLEAVASGLPIVCSDVCGDIPYFVLNSYNGYTFSHKKANDLKSKMEKIINLSDEVLLEFSRNSRKLSQRITPEITAKTILCMIEKNEVITNKHSLHIPSTRQKYDKRGKPAL
jgi:glycosyltransferase involved in cell wall biosynthesis